MRSEFILKTTKNNVLRISAFGTGRINSSPCIIYVHGFKGFKDWGFVPYSAEFFARAGYFVLTFNFSHNGTGDSLAKFTELDRFAENTFSLEIEELNELIDAYKNGFFGKISGKGIGLVGHSRGGGISLLTASKRKDVNAVATWASVANFDRYTERQKERWREKGVFEVLNTRTKQVMKLNTSLLEDIEKNKDDYLNIGKAVRNLNIPLLIAQGEQDLAVKPSEAEKLFSFSNKDLTELFLIPGAGHTFNAAHPFEESNPKLELLLNKTLKFFNNNLN